MPISSWDELRELMKGKKNAPLIVGAGSSQKEETKVTKTKMPSIPLPKDYDWNWLKEQAEKPRVGSPVIEGYLAVITQYDRKQKAKQVDISKFPYASFHYSEGCCPLCQALDKMTINRRSWAQNLFLPPIHDFCLCHAVYLNSPLKPFFVFPPKELVEQWYGDRFLERVLFGEGEYEPPSGEIGERVKIGIKRLKQAMADGYLKWDEQRRDIVVSFLPPFEGVPERLPLGLFPTVDEIVLHAQRGWKWKEWEEWLSQPYTPLYATVSVRPSLLQLLAQLLKSLLHRS